MFAITTIIKKPSGSYEIHDGALIRLPPDLSTPQRIRDFVATNKAGWSRDSLGYSIYSKYDFEGNLVIVPGLNIAEDPAKKRKIHDYTFSTTRAGVEQYVQGIIDFEKAALETATEDVNMLIHDLRRISGAIYNAALEAESYINQNNLHDAKVRVQNVQATQQILKIRTDVLDFVGNPASIVDRKPIDIYRRTDKVCRIFKPSGQKKKVDVFFEGASHLRSIGPEVFEIVPYVLLDNGIKYSPEGSRIDVGVWDEAEKIVLQVESYGPRILSHELLAIFEKGYRGKFAQSQTAGTGIGLFLMREIVESHFGGEVSAEQLYDDNITVNTETFYRTKFEVILPSGQ